MTIPSDSPTWNQPITEAWGDVIDPMDTFRSEPGFFGGSQFGQADRPDARLHGDNWPHFTDEQQLATIRGAGTYIAETDPVAINIVQTLTSYGVGEGMNVEVTPKPGVDADGAAQQVQEVIDEFTNRTMYFGHLDGELFARTRKAGERFVRTVDIGNGMADIEVIEPSWVTQPTNIAEVLYHFGRHDLADLDWKYGIATPKNRPSDVKAYFVMRYGDAQDYDIIEPNRMVHVKANVDTGVKRGLSDFYGGTEEWIADSRKTLKNILKGAGVQASIAIIRKHQKGATNAAIDSAADSNVEFHTRTPAREGTSAPRQIPTERWYPGKIVDQRGYDVMYGPMGTPVGPQLVQVVEASLRHAGRRWGFPEDMISGNASTTNYASILEAHTPFTILMKRTQKCEVTHTEETLWQVVEIACSVGRLPYDVDSLKAMVNLGVAPPDIETRDQQLDHNIRKEQNERGLLSLRTWAKLESLDYEEEQANRADEPKPEVLPQPGFGNPLGANPIPRLAESEELRVKDLAFSLLESNDN